MEVREKNVYELSDDRAKKVPDDNAFITYVCTFLKHGAILCLL